MFIMEGFLIIITHASSSIRCPFFILFPNPIMSLFESPNWALSLLHQTSWHPRLLYLNLWKAIFYTTKTWALNPTQKTKNAGPAISPASALTAFKAVLTLPPRVWIAGLNAPGTLLHSSAESSFQRGRGDPKRPVELKTGSCVLFLRKLPLLNSVCTGTWLTNELPITNSPKTQSQSFNSSTLMKQDILGIVRWQWKTHVLGPKGQSQRPVELQKPTRAVNQPEKHVHNLHQFQDILNAQPVLQNPFPLQKGETKSSPP